MSFFETPARRLQFVRAGGATVLAIVFGVFPFLADVDQIGREFMLSLAGCCALVAFVCLRSALRTPASATVTSVLARVPRAQQASHYRRVLWLSLVAFPV